MTYEEMKRQLSTYNWDDGFDLPQKVFYLGDGFTYFLTYAHNIGGTKEWFCFIDNLYEAIRTGRYVKSEHHYTIPLNKVQRYQMGKNNIPNVFLEDV